MREISLDHLRTLVTAADLASLAAAASALHLAPPTVTVHLAELEARVGARLLHRGRGPAVPTALGVRFIERARRLLADADAAVDEVRNQIAGRSGVVRLGASTGVLAYLLPPVLDALREIAPGVDLQLSVLTSRESMMRVAAGRMDLGIVALPQDAPAGVRLLPWRRDPIEALVPAQWRPPKRVTAKWLAGKPLILNDASTSLFRQTAEWFAAAGVHCSPHIEINFSEAARALVGASYGAAILPAEARHGPADARIAARPLSPPLWRELAVATMDAECEGPVKFVLRALELGAGSALRAQGR